MVFKISVAVTCYNHSDYIEKCLRSIFEQTHQEIELLVFNDGSTDNSDEVITKVLETSPFAETHYFSAENKGVARVRNEALAKFTGDFLFFMDSDNFLNENHLEILLTELSKKSADIAYCQLWDFEHKHNLLREDLDFSWEKELEGNLIDVSSLVKREVLKNVQFDETLQNLEDFDFWLNIFMQHQAKAIFVSETKLNYRVLDDSRSARDDWEQYYQSYFYILDKYRDKISDDIIHALQSNVFLWVKNYEALKQDLAQDFEQKLADKDQHIKDQDEFIQKALHDKDVHIESQAAEIENLKNSPEYRLGRKLRHPFRK
ncbi:glycosyltransferase family 2 protein [Lactococcus nasutitermitis]|uniref:Glycosyltransferase family 2 protein n=1 Tax=Lactococcus nasutitermitis TaxID=1652957 RepID=A0ABV9JG71_9LACT|nr:glycosyltransferase family 2 protein [Lactococcus nasutitermitis]